MDTSDRTQRPPWRQARWVVPAALLLILIVIAVTVLATSGRAPHREKSPGRQATGASRSGQDQACPADGSGQSIPTAPPPDLVWKNVGAILVPTSATAGPGRIEGSIWSCYAHTPTGAMLAAYDIFATLTGPDWHAVAEREIAPGPGQRAFIAAGLSQKYAPPQPGTVAQPVGFTVVTYTSQQATIQTLSDDGNGAYLSDQRTVAWIGGDWKLVMTPDGTVGPDPQVVSSANGFVLWGSGNG
jgi:hypothetical protein